VGRKTPRKLSLKNELIRLMLGTTVCERAVQGG
jgi:hypothetical protein